MNIYVPQEPSTNILGTRPSARVAIYCTSILFISNLIGYLDRSILTLFVGPIKKSLSLSDGEMGLMMGPAFVLTFSLVGLFGGALVDRMNRRNLLIAAIALWTLCVAAGGVAANGVELFVARMGVGFGEAVLFPVAVSQIADYFEPAKRGKPYGLFSVGIYAGMGLSLVMSGVILPWSSSASAMLLNVGYTIEPWRITLFFMVVPGLICCLLLATTKEPARETRGVLDKTPWQEGITEWWRRSSVLLPHHLSLAFATFAVYSVIYWLPTAFIREHAIAPRTAGLMTGSVISIVGMGSAVIAGMIADRMTKKYGAAGSFKAMFFQTPVSIIGFIVFLNASTVLVILFSLVLILSPLAMSIICGIIGMSDFSPASSRGQITSIYFLFTGIIGAAGGPAAIGYFNDVASTPSNSHLGEVIGVTGLVATVLAFFFAALMMRAVSRHGNV